MKKLISFTLLLAIISCNQPLQKEYKHLNYSENILDYTISPKTAFDKSGLMFSDQGAWFAYSSPKKESTISGFSGPFLMTQQNGVWSSKSLSYLAIKNNSWDSISSCSYSCHLEQIFSNKNLTLKQELVFLSGHTALIKSTLTNIGKKELNLSYQWKGTPILAEGISITTSKNNLTLVSTKSKAIGHLIFPKETILKNNDSTYQSQLQKIKLQPKTSVEFTISQTFIFPEYSWETELEKIKTSSFNTILKTRKQEKDHQLQQIISNSKKEFNAHKYAEVLAKSHLTLQNNWRIPAGEIKYEGLFPSYHYKWFNGFWAWDSWKHAVGLSYFNNSLAKNQLKLMFEFQNEDGFIVDCVFRDTLIEKPNYRDTKPPLSVWAAYKIYEKDNDLNFVKELYPKLKKYHYWWYKKRDHDKDGLCEYGSTDGSLVAAKWESGMDNAIRFDNSKILKNEEGAYSLDQESVDLNAYLYAEKHYLAKLASILQLKKDVTQLQTEAETLKLKIQDQFFDAEDGWFYDTNLEGTNFIKGEGCEGWTALWAKAAAQQQAEAVKLRMMDSEKFFTKVPFQTMSADHPKFNPLKGYWRGPNWLDQAYFGVKGLQNYGFNEEAQKATIQIIEGTEGILGKGKSIRENYHPLTGKGLNAENFSWSAAHIIMLLMEN